MSPRKENNNNNKAVDDGEMDIHHKSIPAGIIQIQERYFHFQRNIQYCVRRWRVSHFRRHCCGTDLERWGFNGSESIAHFYHRHRAKRSCTIKHDGFQAGLLRIPGRRIPIERRCVGEREGCSFYSLDIPTIQWLVEGGTI
eukprot:scaffold12306_cov109-Cylindrotheca_fusiformis.AAC.6